MSAATCRRDQTNWPKPAKNCAPLRGRRGGFGILALNQRFLKEGLNKSQIASFPAEICPIAKQLVANVRSGNPANALIFINKFFWIPRRFARGMTQKQHHKTQAEVT